MDKDAVHINNGTTIGSTNAIPGHMKTITKKIHAPQCSQQHSLQ